MIIEKLKRLGLKTSIKKLLGYELCFTCGIRIKGEKALYQKGLKQPFLVLPHSREYWYADPLLYTYDGKTILFMEAYSSRKHKGEIVCSEIIDDKFTEIIPVIEEPFHMSFPNVFEHNGTLYMIPEVEASGGIRIYKCEAFPKQWSLAIHIDTPVPVVDSVIEHINGNIINILASTYTEENTRLVKYYRFCLDMTNPEKITFSEYTEKNTTEEFSYENRNAGRYISTPSGKKIHCTQTSTPAIYGYSLKFIKTAIKETFLIDIPERFVEIKPTDIHTVGFKRYQAIGVHTYSESNDIEAIDIGYYEWNPRNSYWMNRLKNKLFKQQH